MEAGKELDALVAEKVMGWTTYEEYVHGPLMHGGGMMTLYEGKGATRNGRTWSVDGFKPSTDMAAAWEVFERFVGDDQHPLVRYDGLRSDGNPRWTAALGSNRGDADTAPHAICLAAVAAISHV